MDTHPLNLNKSLKTNDPILQKLLDASKDMLGGDPGSNVVRAEHRLLRYVQDQSNALVDRFTALIRHDWLNGSLRETVDEIERLSKLAHKKGYPIERMYQKMVNTFVETMGE